jgi:hypothetical protein
MSSHQTPANTQTVKNDPYPWLLCHPVSPGYLSPEVLYSLTQFVKCYTYCPSNTVVENLLAKFIHSLISSFDSIPERGSYSAVPPHELRVCVEDKDSHYNYWIVIPPKMAEAKGKQDKEKSYYATARFWVSLSNHNWRLDIAKPDGKPIITAPDINPGECTLYLYLTDFTLLSQIPYEEELRFAHNIKMYDFITTVKSFFSFLD